MDEISQALKEVELRMFLEFLKICKKNSLSYFLVGGTALGAVRHKGFIPWDDDIDVALPREDYDRFLEIAQGLLPDDMFLQTYKTDKNTPFSFAKIRKTDTTFIEKPTSMLKINHGVYIDIFPLDGYPKTFLKRKILSIKCRLLQLPVSNALFTEVHEQLTVKQKLANKLSAILYPDYREAVEKRDLLFKKHPYHASEIIANYSGAWGIKEVMPKEIFGEGIKGSFEGIDVILPQHYHQYLTRLYGDYMELPPIEKRKAPHNCTVIDLGRSYIEYMK